MLGLVVGIIVIYLVIVPGYEPWHERMHALQIGISAILRVAIAVLHKRVGFGTCVPAHERVAPRRFVDVVTHKYDEIHIVLGHVTIGRKIPLFIMLTRGESHPKPI
jgi:hypothetical protein